MKKSFLGLAALACAFAGVAVGLVGANNVKTIEATDSPSAGVYLVGTFNSWAQNDASKMYFASGTTYQYYTTITLAVGNEFKIFDGEHFSGDNGFIGYIDSALVAAGANFSGGNNSGNDGNVKCETAGRYKVTYTYKDADDKRITAIDAVPYVVTEYAVEDGTKEASAIATEYAPTDSAFTPTYIPRAGYAFGGWFTDEVCATAYSATTLPADTNLYAKYTSCNETNKKAIYFKSAGETWADTYVYSFGSSLSLGSWPGTKMTSAFVGNLRFNGTGLLAAYYYGDSGDTKVIFNNGDANPAVGVGKTNDLILTENAYYTLSDTVNYSGDAAIGSAAKVAVNIASTIAAATEASACKVSKADAQALVTAYDALANKDIIDVAAYYTFTDKNLTDKKDWTLAQIMVLMRSLAAAAPVPAIDSNAASDSTPFMIIAFGLIALGGCASYLLLRKRNED